MLYKILKFFFDDRPESISFYKLYTNLVKWNKERRLPYDYELPQVISLDSDFHRKIIKLYKETLNDGLERAVSVFWADGELVLSKVIKGSERAVTTNSNIKISYTKSIHKDYLKKEIFVDNSLYSSKDIYYKNIPDKIDLKYLFNMHTHPKHVNHDGSYYYGIFSAQDIRSLINSNAIISGLIRDDFLLIFKTKKSITNADKLEDNQITLHSLTDKYGFIVYQGQFKGKLYRFSSELINN